MKKAIYVSEVVNLATIAIVYITFVVEQQKALIHPINAPVAVLSRVHIVNSVVVLVVAMVNGVNNVQPKPTLVTANVSSLKPKTTMGQKA